MFAVALEDFVVNYKYDTTNAAISKPNVNYFSSTVGDVYSFHFITMVDYFLSARSVTSFPSRLGQDDWSLSVKSCVSELWS